MIDVEQKRGSAAAFDEGRAGPLSRFLRSSDGTAAIEFALLAIPYFLVIFAIVETFIAFTGEQLVSNAVDTLARRLRTGQITYNMGRTTDMTRTQFRQAFCNEISVLMRCSTSEAATPSKFYLDVKTYNNFASIPTAITRVSSAPDADINTAAFQYAPGGPGTVNMVRAYYKWQVTADIIRPYITNIRPSGSTAASYYLIVQTAVFQNEQYP